MDEVSRIRKELEKTVPKNDTKRALELLRSLESIPMTLDVLQKTHIGMAVNKIRKSVDNPEVSSLSKSMVKKWKKLLSSSSTTSTTTGSSGGTNTNNNNTNNNNNKDTTTSSNNNNTNSSSSNSNTNEQSQSVSATPNVNNNYHHQDSSQDATSPVSSAHGNSERVGKRPCPTQTEVPPTNSEVRLKCRQLLTDALKKPLPKDLMQETFLEEEILAGRIEESIYQEFKQTDMKYKNRVRSRVSNLGDMKNPYLRFNVLRGDLAPERIARMTAEEMASDELKREREKYTKEAINDHQMTLTSGTKTSEIKCPACKKFNVTYNQVQTRSADEPMTTFCYCNECGKRWKFC